MSIPSLPLFTEDMLDSSHGAPPFTPTEQKREFTVYEKAFNQVCGSFGKKGLAHPFHVTSPRLQTHHCRYLSPGKEGQTTDFSPSANNAGPSACIVAAAAINSIDTIIPR